MDTIAICLIATMAIIMFLKGTNDSCKRGYIIFDRIELQPVPFGELSKMAAWRAGSEKVQSMHIAEAKG